MTQVDDDIKFGMIEAISHLIHRDYEAIVQVRAGSFAAVARSPCDMLMRMRSHRRCRRTWFGKFCFVMPMVPAVLCGKCTVRGEFFKL